MVTKYGQIITNLENHIGQLLSTPMASFRSECEKLKSNPGHQVSSLGHLCACMHHHGGDGDADQQGGVLDLHQQGGHSRLWQVHLCVPGGARLSPAQSTR